MHGVRRVRIKRTANIHKNHRAGTERFCNRCPEMAAPAERSFWYICRDRLCRVRQFSQQRERKLASPERGGIKPEQVMLCLKDLYQGKSRWKRSTGTFPKSKNCKRDTGRSGLVRSALEKLSLFSPTCSVRSKARAQRVSPSADGDSEGYSPSKNTSPTVLSWISLMGQQLQNRSVSARWFLIFALPFFRFPA